MTPEQYERAKRLFERATRLPSQEFARFLDEEESDAEVREAVAAMLAFEARCPDFLAGSPLDSNATLEEDFSRPLAVPDQIAGFRILGRLGAGAMGTVFEAEQHSPKRRVALKVLTHLRGSHASEERFRREAEVLARLEHPGIARVIQSGTAIIGDDRVHYIALERIDGLPLDEHCRKRQLPDHRRIELLAQIADAVQHAHARGIVHRDLKPSNILVDKGGMPKVLDFGIARLVDDGSDEIRGVTLAGQVLGTLAYMSPEQASADGQVGVAADIFALGAILYDLLAGAPPHDLGSLSLSQALHRISHVRPTPLSSRCPRAKGDLGTIVDKALELLPERRYSSALAFGDDLRRFLAHEPISARPATFGYRAYRFVQRHRALSASLAITALAVVSSTILAWVLFARAEASRIEALEGRDRARRAERAAEAGRLEAERQRGIAEAVLGYLIRVFDAANPELTPEGRWLTAPELLRVATLGLSDSFTDQPEVHAAVLRALARVQSALSLPEEAEASLSRALERLESSTDDALRLTIRLDRITALLELGRLDEARLELDRCEQATTGSDTPHQRGQLLLARAGLAHAEAQYDIARTAIETALATAKSSEDSSVLLGAYDALGQLELQTGNYEAALAAARMALDLQLHRSGRRHEQFARRLNNLGAIEAQLGQLESAEQSLTDAVDLSKQIFGLDSLAVADRELNLAVVLRRLGKLAEARPLYEHILDVHHRLLGPEHPRFAQSRNNFGRLLEDLGEPGAAAEHYQHAAEVFRSAHGKGHPETATAEHNLARCWLKLGRAEEAEALATAVLDRRRTALGSEHDAVADTLMLLGNARQALGQATAARACFQEAARLYAAALGESSPYFLDALRQELSLLEETGDWNDAFVAGERCWSFHVRALGEQAELTRNIAAHVARIAARLGHDREREAWDSRSRSGR